MCQRLDADKPEVLYINPPSKPIWRGWMKPKEARKYAGGIDTRTWRKWKEQGLRVQTVGGVVLTRPEWIDAFILRHESGQSIKNVASEMVKGVRE